MAARPPSAHLTGTSSRSEPEPLMGRREERANFWDAVLCNRPRLLSPYRLPYRGTVGVRGVEDRSRRSGNGSGIEPVKMFGAVRGSPSRAAEARMLKPWNATVRIVKLAPRYFVGRECLSRSGVRPLDFGDHKEVRPGPIGKTPDPFDFWPDYSECPLCAP